MDKTNLSRRVETRARTYPPAKARGVSSYFAKDFEGELLALVQGAIDRQVVPEIKQETRVDTGELRASTRTYAMLGKLYLMQGGTPECDYAVWIELRFGDFSNAIAAIEWDFR